jgi:hypothetical protein
MVREAARCDRRLVIAHQMRWHPLILKLRELVTSGTLGRIGYVHMDFFYGREGYGGTYPMPYPLLVQGSIHHFDFLRWVLDAEPRWVWATNFSPPWVSGPGMRSGYVAFEMENGVQACYRAVPTRADQTSWLTEWRIEGTEGLAEVKKDRVSLNGEEVLSGWEDGETFNNRRLPDLSASFSASSRLRARRAEPGISAATQQFEMMHADLRRDGRTAGPGLLLDLWSGKALDAPDADWAAVADQTPSPSLSSPLQVWRGKERHRSPGLRSSSLRSLWQGPFDSLHSPGRPAHILPFGACRRIPPRIRSRTIRQARRLC